MPEEEKLISKLSMGRLRLYRFAGFDADVSFSLLNRLWTALSGLIILVLVGLFTTPSVQGFYYTFNSMIYMQVFIEMGLGVALVQLIGHEMARLSHGDNGKIVGDEGAKKRLHSLVRFSGVWFTVGSSLLFLLLCTLGTLFFTRFGKHQLGSGEFSGVIIAWVLVAFGVSCGLVVNAALFVVEGSGHVASAARIRLLQGMVSASAAAITLALGGGLFAIAFQTILMPIVGALALARRHRRMLADLWFFRSDLAGLSWRREVWPFQSRIAISWLSGFFTLQVFSPLLFALVGATAAGRMGMSLQIFTALNGLLIVLVTARTPIYTRLIALGQREELRERFGRAFRQSAWLLLIALMGVLPTLYLGGVLFPRIAERIVPWPYLLLLGLTCVANHTLFAEAAFLRAHRQEPFMLLSFASGILTAVAASVLITLAGLSGAVFAYAGVTLLFALPIGTKIFLPYWKIDA